MMHRGFDVDNVDPARNEASNLLEEWYSERTAGTWAGTCRAAELHERILDAMTQLGPSSGESRPKIPDPESE